MTVDYGVSGLGPRKRDRWPAAVPRAAEKLRHLAAAHGALPGVNSPSQPLLCSAVPCMCASVIFLGLLRPFPRGSSPCSPLSVSVLSASSLGSLGVRYSSLYPPSLASEVPGTQWALQGGEGAVVPCGRRVNPMSQKTQWLVCGPEWPPGQTPIVRARNGYCLGKTCLQHPVQCGQDRATGCSCLSAAPRTYCVIPALLPQSCP